MQRVDITETEKGEDVAEDIFKDIMEENIPKMKNILKTFREKVLIGQPCSFCCIGVECSINTN